MEGVDTHHQQIAIVVIVVVVGVGGEYLGVLNIVVCNMSDNLILCYFLGYI